MKKNKYIIIATIVLLLIVIGTLIYVKTPKITITKYAIGIGYKIEIINVFNKKDIEKINSFSETIEPLRDGEQVDLALPQEIVITYKEIEIGLSLDNEYYCYYTDNSKDIASLAHMPEGLLDWVNEKIN